eukprot:bmy_13649T0
MSKAGSSSLKVMKTKPRLLFDFGSIGSSMASICKHKQSSGPYRRAYKELTGEKVHEHQSEKEIQPAKVPRTRKKATSVQLADHSGSHTLTSPNSPKNRICLTTVYQNATVPATSEHSLSRNSRLPGPSRSSDRDSALERRRRRKAVARANSAHAAQAVRDPPGPGSERTPLPGRQPAAPGRRQSRPNKLLQTPARTESRRRGVAGLRAASRPRPPAPPPAAWRQQKAAPEQRRRPSSARGRTYPASSSFLLAFIWSPSAPFWLPAWGATLPPPAPDATPVPAPVPTGDSPSGAASCPFSVAPVVSMGCSSPASDMLGRGARLLQQAATTHQAGAAPARAPARHPRARPLTSPPMTPRGPLVPTRREGTAGSAALTLALPGLSPVYRRSRRDLAPSSLGLRCRCRRRTKATNTDTLPSPRGAAA